jgi:hypothetical protein
LAICQSLDLEIWRFDDDGGAIPRRSFVRDFPAASARRQNASPAHGGHSREHHLHLIERRTRAPGVYYVHVRGINEIGAPLPVGAGVKFNPSVLRGESLPISARTGTSAAFNIPMAGAVRQGTFDRRRGLPTARASCITSDPRCSGNRGSKSGVAIPPSSLLPQRRCPRSIPPVIDSRS